MCGCANEKMRMVVALFSLSTGSANLLVCMPFTEAEQKRGRDKGKGRVSSHRLAMAPQQSHAAAAARRRSPEPSADRLKPPDMAWEASTPWAQMWGAARQRASGRVSRSQDRSDAARRRSSSAGWPSAWPLGLAPFSRVRALWWSGPQTTARRALLTSSKARRQRDACERSQVRGWPVAFCSGRACTARALPRTRIDSPGAKPGSSRPYGWFSSAPRLV